jgi:hypothetical protein
MGGSSIKKYSVRLLGFILGCGCIDWMWGFNRRWF